MNTNVKIISFFISFFHSNSLFFWNFNPFIIKRHFHPAHSSSNVFSARGQDHVQESPHSSCISHLVIATALSHGNFYLTFSLRSSTNIILQDNINKDNTVKAATITVVGEYLCYVCVSGNFVVVVCWRIVVVSFSFLPFFFFFFFFFFLQTRTAIRSLPLVDLSALHATAEPIVFDDEDGT